MTLSKSRKAMCFILTMLFSVGSILFFGTLIAKSTVLNEGYMNRIFEYSNVNEQCEKAFEDRVAVLEAQSTIPARVFDTVFKTNDTAASNVIGKLYSSQNPTLYSKNQIKQFESLCKEYLEGNNMQYDSELIHNTAIKATEAYNDCFGFNNADTLVSYIGTLNSNSSRLISIGMLLMAVPIIMLLVLYRRSREIMFNIFASLTTSGMIFTVSSVLCLIFKTAQRLDISPQVYSQAFGNAVKGLCFISIIFGLLLTGITIFVNVKITKSLDSKK